MTSQTLDVPVTTTEASLSPYGYTPTTWICVLYVGLFATTTALHVVQVVYFRGRSFWIIPTIVTCGICEILGWSARLWSSRNPTNINAFLMQISTTIIAPTFLTAGFYTVLGSLITLLGARYSRLSPNAYLISFLSADVIALVVQSVGGGKASLALQNNQNADPGSHIMLGGIFLQLAGMTLYLLLATEFLLRSYFKKPFKPSPPPSKYWYDDSSTTSIFDEKASEFVVQLEGGRVILGPVSHMVIGLTLATLLVLVRSIYRTVELLGGWNGRIITTEKYFNYLDAAPIVLAMFTLNLFHPIGLLHRQ